MEISPLAELRAIFAEWLARYRLVRALRSSGLGLALAAGLGLLLGAALVAGRLVLLAELAWLVGGLLLVGLIVGGMLGLAWPVAHLPTARRFDRQFGLRERLSTALELAEHPQASPLTTLQLADTLEAARKVDLSRVLPLRLPWRSLAAALALCALTAGLAWGLRGQFELTQQQRELEKAIAAEVEKVAETAAEIEQLETLDPQAEATILQSLQATIQELQAAETTAEALSILAEGQAELQAQISPNSQATLEGLSQAGQALAGSENPGLRSAGEALSELDLPAAAEALQNLDLSGLSADELAELSAQLSAAAHALQSSQPAAAAALQNAANAAAAAASGDAAQAAQANQAAQAALQQAAGELQSLQGALQAGQAAMQAANSLAQAQAALGASGAGAGTGVTSSGQSGSGVSTDPNTQGSGSGGGAGRGEGSGSEAGSGQAAGTTPIQTTNGPGDGGLTPFESLYIPQRLGGEGGPDVNLPGGNTPGETVVGAQERPVGDPGSLQVPYVDALPYYSEVNRQAIDSGLVPLDLRELVRRYFSALEP
jgi:hypothetical protein